MTTEQFLSNFPSYYIQTFDDKAKDPSLVTHGPAKDYPISKLKELNEKGAGIFFTPNKFFSHRKADECQGVNAWFFETDDVSIEEQWKRICAAPLMPSLVTKTRSSLHCYYLAVDAKIENFRLIQSGLIQHFKSDRACKDVSRVLRIPGYYHNKKDPVMVEIIHEQANKYTEAEMLRAFPYVPEKKINDTFWQHAAALSSREVLIKASGTAIVNGEIFTFRPRSGGGLYIDVNGTPADAWIDEKGMIGSGKGGGPTYIQWLEYYGHSKADIADWLKDNFPAKLPLEDDVDSKRTIKEVGKLMEQTKDLTWGVERLDNTFTPLSRGRYMILVGETGMGKTAFAFNMAIKNAEIGHKVLYLSLEMTNAALLMRYAMSKLGISKTDWRNKVYDQSAVNLLIENLPSNLRLGGRKFQNGITVPQIAELASKGHYSAIFVDNFGFVHADARTDLDRAQKISREFVNLKNQFPVALVVLHHFRKGSDDKKGPRSLNSVLGSAKISHDVDFAMQVWRNTEVEDDEEDFLKKRSSMLVMMMKDRDFGDLGSQYIYYDKGEFYSKFPDNPTI